MQVARLLEPPRPRGIATKLVNRSRARRSSERRYSQVRHPGDVSDAGAVRRQSRGRAGRFARLFRQGAGATDARRSGVAGGAAAIARAAAARSSPANARRRARQGAARGFGDGVIDARNWPRAPSRCPTAASPCRCRAAPRSSSWPRWRRAHESTSLRSTASCSAAGRWPATKRAGSATARARRHRRREFDAARRALMSAAPITSAAAGQLDLRAPRRSPGSALKPFIYGMAFDDGGIHPET